MARKLDRLERRRPATGADAVLAYRLGAYHGEGRVVIIRIQPESLAIVPLAD